MELQILSESNRYLFNRIYDLYKTDKEKILLYVKAEKPANNKRLKFEDETKLVLVEERETLRVINKGLRIFKSTLTKIVINKPKKQAWFVDGRRVRQVTFTYVDRIWKDSIINFLPDNLKWITEYETGHSIGYIWRRGYTNPTDYYRKENLLVTGIKNGTLLFEPIFCKHLKYVSKNWEYLVANPLVASDCPNLRDLVRFAAILNEKINWTWSKKRFEEQHNEWSTKVLTVTSMFDSELEVNEVFKSIQIPELELIDTKVGLIQEGQRQKHCVGTYTQSVNNGSCAIFRYKNDWTVQLSKELRILQMKGKMNSNPPDEVREDLELHLKNAKSQLKVDKIQYVETAEVNDWI